MSFKTFFVIRTSSQMETRFDDYKEAKLAAESVARDEKCQVCVLRAISLVAPADVAWDTDEEW